LVREVFKKRQQLLCGGVSMGYEAEEIEETGQTNPRQRCQRNGAASLR